MVAGEIWRALRAVEKRLVDSAGEEAATFAALSLDAVEAKLESVKQQVWSRWQHDAAVGQPLHTLLARRCVCCLGWPLAPSPAGPVGQGAQEPAHRGAHG